MSASNQGMEQRRLATRGLLALGLLLLLLPPLGLDAVAFSNGTWGYTPLTRARGRFEDVVAAQHRNRMINVSIGLAARWAAQGKPQSLILPKHLYELADPPPDLFGTREIPAMQRNLTRIVVGGSLRRWDYDPRVTPGVFDAMLAEGSVKKFPFHIYAVRSPETTWSLPFFPRIFGDPRDVLPWASMAGRRLIAVTDSLSNRVAIIPFPLSPFAACATVRQSEMDRCRSTAPSISLPPVDEPVCADPVATW